MNTVIHAKQLRGSFPAIVGKVRRGARFTVLYRGQPAFQVVPVETAPETACDLADDPLYRAKPLGRSNDNLSAADHDSLLYRKLN
jgi:antitoxin (DNA-binding transcriptional repressor) of toxin-antitoxin stability system